MQASLQQWPQAGRHGMYARSVLSSGLLGETVVSMHETLNVPRLTSTAMQLMLPWRMPRTG
jgi:carotenoid 1,2-hydratase